MKPVFEKCYRIAHGLYPSVNSRNQSKHFSFVLKKSAILAIGVNNSEKTHPLAQKYGYIYNAIHSELAALISYGKEWDRRLTLLNIRIMAYDRKSTGLSMPCKRCIRLLSDHNVTRIIFSDHNFKFHEMKLNV